MRLLDDERGQSVQVGAAILLGFVVIAITMYQVEVVSSQNAEVEFNHDQEIRQDLTELRNSIDNAGTQGESDSVSVKLGGQYPPRTIFVNPPPIQGSLQSEAAGNISFGNAEVQGSYGGSGNATKLVIANHTTKRLVYTPRYFELNDAGVTTIEHSLAFKSFENNATDPLTSQSVVQGDSLTLTVLQGNLSEQGTQSISVDPQAVSGPTDPVTIQAENSSEPIELRLPTETPSVWNETIGTAWGVGENDSRVVAWNDTTESVTVQLRKDRYQLQMAMVEVGDGAGDPETYNVSDPDSASSGQSGPYEIQWQDGQTETVSGGQVTLTAETNPSGFEGAAVDFYLKDGGTGAIIQSEDNETDANGQAEVAISNFNNNGTVDVYVSSGGSSDVHTITVQKSGGGGGGAPSADVVSYVQGSATDTNGNGALSFQLENNGSRSAAITGVSVTVGGGPASTIYEQNGGDCLNCHEMVFEGSDSGYYESGDEGTAYSLGTTVTLTDQAGLSGGSTMNVYMQYFRKNKNDREGVSGRQTTVDVTFADGSSESYTFTPT